MAITAVEIVRLRIFHCQRSNGSGGFSGSGGLDISTRVSTDLMDWLRVARKLFLFSQCEGLLAQVSVTKKTKGQTAGLLSDEL
jgi:hypothetical protein